MQYFDPGQILREAGFRATPGRIAFLKLLEKSSKPLAIQDVLDKLKSEKLDQATVYRIAEALKTKGIIQYVNMEHGHAHFELVPPIHHHHAICERCGKVVDISKCNIRSLEDQVRKVSGFKQLNRHSLEFFGLCKECAKKTTKWQ